MSLEEQARIVLNQAIIIEGTAQEIQRLSRIVLRRDKVKKDEFVELSDEKKQLILQAYQTKKAELLALVEALP